MSEPPEDRRETDPPKGTNALAMVAGALIALFALFGVFVLATRCSGA
ncbi:MAG: hypothetical protein ACJ79K_09905 [Gemmatimonadaceae bacterium]